MKSDEFKDELEEFNKKKKEIEEKAKKEIDDLARSYLTDANLCGYFYDPESKKFNLEIVKVMEVTLTCQGVRKYPAPKIAVHRVLEVDDSKFNARVSAFDGTVPGKPFSVKSREKVLNLTKEIAKTNTDFFNAFSSCFKQCHMSGKEQLEILEEQNLSIHSYPRYFAKNCRLVQLAESYRIIDYYGGFECYLKNIQCEIHFYTTSRESYKYLEEQTKSIPCFGEFVGFPYIASEDITQMKIQIWHIEKSINSAKS